MLESGSHQYWTATTLGQRFPIFVQVLAKEGRPSWMCGRQLSHFGVKILVEELCE
jgi:hypothetical protein